MLKYLAKKVLLVVFLAYTAFFCSWGEALKGFPLAISQHQETGVYQVPVIPRCISNRLFKVATSNALDHRDLGEVEKYYRVALLEVAFVCQL